MSFGFDTATKVYSELTGNLGLDAISAKKTYHFVRLMGRSASHITLEVALQTHPNLTLIGEEVEAKKQTLGQCVNAMVELILERAVLGKYYGLIVLVCWSGAMACVGGDFPAAWCLSSIAVVLSAKRPGCVWFIWPMVSFSMAHGSELCTFFSHPVLALTFPPVIFCLVLDSGYVCCVLGCHPCRPLSAPCFPPSPLPFTSSTARGCN